MLKKQMADSKAKLAIGSRIINELVSAKNDLMLPYDVISDELESIGALRETLAESSRQYQELTFTIDKDSLYFAGMMLIEDSIMHYPLIERLAELKITEITFLPGITTEDLLTFLTALNKTEDTRHTNTASQIKTANILINNDFSALRSRDNSKSEKLTSNFQGTPEFYDYAIGTLNQIFEKTKSAGFVNMRKTRDLVGSIIERLYEHGSELILIASLDKSENDALAGHSLNVAILSAALGIFIGFSKPVVTALAIAAILHDVGKLELPQYVISKGKTLTKSEQKEMEQHPIYGAALLSSLNGTDRLAAIVAFEHHIGFDLSGFPEGVSIPRIHLFSRMVHVVDEYENGLRNTETAEKSEADQVLGLILEEAGYGFDPVIAIMFAKMIGIYPVGESIRLCTGETALVYQNNEDDLFNPLLAVLRDQNGEKTEPTLIKARDICGPILSSVTGYIDYKSLGIEIEELFVRA